MSANLVWPEPDLGRLLQALAREAGLQPRPVDAPRPPANAQPPDSREFRAWMESACAWLGLETEIYGMLGHRVDSELRRAAPAILYVSGQNGYLGLLAVRRSRAYLLAPDETVCQIPANRLRKLLCRHKEAPLEAEVDRLLQRCGISGRRHARAREALLRERLSARIVAVAWQLRTSPGAGFAGQLRGAGLDRRLLTLCAAHAAEYLLWLAAWWALGSAALQDRLDPGLLTAWALILLTIIPFRLLTTWSQGSLSIGGGGLLRQRLLAGALKLNPEEMRREGAGQLLGRVIESEVLELLALSGGLAAGLACFESLVAAVVIGLGAGGFLHVALFLVWIAVALALARRYAAARAAWTQSRLGMTHALVENMTGHRTRLTQESPAQWHRQEDNALDEYARLSARMDRANLQLTALVPRGWLLVGIAGVGPAFLAPHSSPTALAVGLGGVILAWQALRRFVAGAGQLAGAGISWKQVAPLFHAAARVDQSGASAVAPIQADQATVLEARGVGFRYRPAGEPVLHALDLTVHRGDWLLLEGASGGGKSTFASLLAGLRVPTSGLLLAAGLDRQTLGSRGWRRRVACAPQYHENHVFSSTFAFNLLMGRHWPPTQPDMDEATEICRELGLGPLLDRMPAGIDQMVGESGWQLSQGERSRMFIARALLQGGELVILDESLAALDPETLRQSLECVLRRSKTLLVVAHP